jgi:hypothetical protein
VVFVCTARPEGTTAEHVTTTDDLDPRDFGHGQHGRQDRGNDNQTDGKRASALHHITSQNLKNQRRMAADRT